MGVPHGNENLCSFQCHYSAVVSGGVGGAGGVAGAGGATAGGGMMVIPAVLATAIERGVADNSQTKCYQISLKLSYEINRSAMSGFLLHFMSSNYLLFAA